MTGSSSSNPATAAAEKSHAKADGRSLADSDATSEINRLGGRFLANGSSPSWSPTGSSIVYGHGDELMILDIEHGKARRLGTSGRFPAWSTGDGRHIAYVRGPAGEEEICLCEAAGGLPQRLAAGKNPRWSVDGRMLYFDSTQKPQCYAIGVDRRQPAVAVAPPGNLLGPAGITSKDGLHAVRQIGDRLQIVDRKTGKPASEWPVAKAVGEVPVWSADGRYLAFAGFQCARGVILGVLDVEKNFLLPVGGSQFGCPTWSPDGSQLAFVVRRNDKAQIWSIKMSALKQSCRFAPACACPDVPQAVAELIGPWHHPLGSLVAIDLSHHCTHAKNGVIDGNLLDLAAGTRLLAGVEFRIGSRLIQLQGQRVPEMPPAVKGIPVHHRVVRLYILHATQHATKAQQATDGEQIAEYRVRYADGDLTTIPVIIGQDVRDWWSTDQESVSRGQVAWAGSNKVVLKDNHHVRLYLSTWKNPHPEKTVESIDYSSMKSKAAPFCVAITAEEPQCFGHQRQAPGQGDKGISTNH